jgi:hypothetical protein
MSLKVGIYEAKLPDSDEIGQVIFCADHFMDRQTVVLLNGGEAPCPIGAGEKVRAIQTVLADGPVNRRCHRVARSSRQESSFGGPTVWRVESPRLHL